jgi:16S rRNA (uracil1498-N3)-methyltransferase
MRRFFCDSITEHSAVITGDDAHHIARVLRMKAGDALSICDGCGKEYAAEICEISPDSITCKLGAATDSEAESPCRITLFQCLPKSGKFETIVQKCTELGVFAIVPVRSARCVVVPGKDFQKKIDRYQRVSLEAAKQSRRAMIPEILPLMELSTIAPCAFDLFLVAYEEEDTLSLKAALHQIEAPKSVALLIGPEGGLDAAEVERLAAAGAVPVSLGKRILRTETAGMAMLAQVQYEVEP